MSWFLLLPLWFSTNVLAYILAPVLPAFASLRFGATDNGNAVGIEPRLPDWLSWFMTPDNSLLGDATYKELNDGGYWSQVRWLWRNPAVGFESNMLSCYIPPTSIPVIYGDPYIKDGHPATAGYCFVKLNGYWSLTYIKQIASRCLYVSLGWQLKTYAEDPSRVKKEPIARYALTIRFPTFYR